MLRYSHGGKQVRESMETRDEATAIRKAQEIMEAPAPVASSDHENELAAYFAAQRKADRLSAHSVNARQPVLLTFFSTAGRERVADVTRADVQRWYDSMERRPKSKETVRAKKEDITEETRHTYVRWLRAFYKFLIERGKMRANPCDGVNLARARPTARRNTITKAEVAKLIDSCQNLALKFILFCGFHAGMRKHEVIEARPEWFDLETGHIHIGPTATWIPKDRERRSVPLSKAFRAFLAVYGKPTPYMVAPDVEKGKAIYRYDFETSYNNHLRACGVKCTFHDARRTFASQLVSAGVSVYKVARWLGDGVAVVEKHYGHLQPDNGDLERGFA